MKNMLEKVLFYIRKYGRKNITGALFLLIAFALFPAGSVFAMEDGEYSVSVDMSGGSGKAAVTSPAFLKVEDGEPIARIQWSSANYDYMIVDGEKYLNQSEEGVNSVFEIPVLCWDEPMDVIADTTAMGSPIEIHYKFIFYQDSVGSKSELPQEAAKRVLCVAFAIIVIGGLLNYYVKKKIYS